MSEIKLTPMMRQYRQAKADIPDDAILLFRLGDFYEMFFEDAARGSAIMDIALTKRGGVPMCGFPYHALEMHLPRLLNAGVKVAIAEQLEDPAQAKGIVKRGISRIITPGTVMDSSVLAPDKNNFLVALAADKEHFALASLDISTGEFKATELDSRAKLETELHRLGALECLISQHQLDEWEKSSALPDCGRKLLWTPMDDWVFAFDYASDALKRQFNVLSLDGFGCRNHPLAVAAAGAVMHYASENLRRSISHLKSLYFYSIDNYMALDAISQRNLELTESMFGSGRDGTLLSVLDNCATPMGGRMLRDWILRPLYDITAINARLESIEALRDDPLSLTEIREIIGSVRDLERIVARINVGSANARDLLALADSLAMIAPVKLLLENFAVPLLEQLREQLHDLPELINRIKATLVDDPPVNLHDGGVIREGFHAGLDELRRASSEGKSWLGALQQKEQERTGIKSLKVKYNRVFGYYIEVSKSNLDLVPEDYLRKQTLVNAERFITPELKEIESKILGAEDKSKALEYQLFTELRDFSLSFTAVIQETATALAAVDVICSLTECARKYRYVRPRIVDDEQLIIEGGRHPVLDATMTEERFVPNSTCLDGDENRMMIITGPNMAGKSTYIRQTALLTIMAQMGSFVPADKMTVGLVDRIFTRVGAADDISRGQSTFMVEMVETANILNHTTEKSLVILDEIGRGTSTFDGLSIAWAVAEFLHDVSRSRTQFATHYHELTELAITRRGVKNYNVAVKEYGEQIIFLRQIVPGGTDKSYGIHVAKLAGIPDQVIKRANVILENLENNAMGVGGQPALTIHHEIGENAAKRYRRTRGKSTKPAKKSDNGSTSEEPFQPLLFD